MVTCPAGTITVLCSLHAYEKMLDLPSVCCSFGLQSFNIFVKTVSNHHAPKTVSNHHAVLLQTAMLQNKSLVRFRGQESPTQPQNHTLIVIAMNENKCRTMK